MIDVHVHVNFLGRRTPDVVDYLRETGVDHAWLLGWEEVTGGLGAGYQHLSNASIAEAAKAHPDLFIPFASVDPRREDPIRYMNERAEQGFKGLGEEKLRLTADNPDLVALYRHAGELGWPVLIHMDVWHPGCSFWYNHDIDAFERVVASLPEVTFIGHGPGWWREISGTAATDAMGYPKEPVGGGGKLPKLLAAYDNIYADISAGSGLNALTRDPEAATAFIEAHWRKLLYGTDCYDTRHIDHLRSLDLPTDRFEAITHDNAASIIPV